MTNQTLRFAGAGGWDGQNAGGLAGPGESEVSVSLINLRSHVFDSAADYLPLKQSVTHTHTHL